MAGRHEFLKTVRGKGLMIGLEFGSPKSLKLKAAWSLLETANAGLFSQIIVIPIFKDHRIVVQVAGHGLNVIKLIPPLTITDTDCDWIESRLRRRHRRFAQGAGLGLDAGQDARGPRDEGARRRLRRGTSSSAKRGRGTALQGANLRLIRQRRALTSPAQGTPPQRPCSAGQRASGSSTSTPGSSARASSRTLTR